MQTVFVSKQKALENLQGFANEQKEPCCVYRAVYGPHLEKEEFHMKKMSEVLDPECDRVIKVLKPVIKVKAEKKPVVRTEAPAPMFPKVRVEIENLWHSLLKPQLV